MVRRNGSWDATIEVKWVLKSGTHRYINADMQGGKESSARRRNGMIWYLYHHFQGWNTWWWCTKFLFLYSFTYVHFYTCKFFIKIHSCVPNICCDIKTHARFLSYIVLVPLLYVSNVIVCLDITTHARLCCPCKVSFLNVSNVSLYIATHARFLFTVLVFVKSCSLVVGSK